MLREGLPVSATAHVNMPSSGSPLNPAASRRPLSSLFARVAYGIHLWDGSGMNLEACGMANRIDFLREIWDAFGTSFVPSHPKWDVFGMPLGLLGTNCKISQKLGMGLGRQTPVRTNLAWIWDTSF